MSRTTRPAARLLAATAVVLAVGAGLAACSSGSSSSSSSATPSATSGASSSVIAPIFVPVADADGTTVDVTVGNAVVMTSDTEPLGDWTADVSDTSVLRFEPGSSGGSADFNPGFEALAAGTADVTMTNSSTGTKVSFTVDVTD
jgi:hypothetical protein